VGLVFKLKPAIKDYIWGGTRLRDEFGKTSDGERLAESWELSCHPDGLSVIDGGKFGGMTLADYLAENPEDMGTKGMTCERFPIMIKLIDARENLSVQVHPNDEYAMEHEGESGKNEMWYVVDCESDSSIIYGFKEEITKAEFRQAIEENTLLDKVNVVPVQKGDIFMIHAGTLHAIGKGCLIAEIQQSSNVTYRVYDYGRPRELHIDKALDVTKRTRSDIPEQTGGTPICAQTCRLIGCEYFNVFRQDICGMGEENCNGGSFTHILLLDGSGTLESGDTYSEKLTAKKGDSFFVSAGTNWRITGECSIIYTVI